MSVFKIHHITKYSYEKPVAESINEIRIFPFQCPEQEVLQHELHITSQPELQTYIDYWGNKTGLFSLIEPHQELVVESKLIVRTMLASQLEVNFNSSFAELEEETSAQLHLMELTQKDNIEQQSIIDAICIEVNSPSTSVAQVVRQSSEHIFNNFVYTKGITTIESTVDEILQHQGGVCQDFAHVLLQILRTLNIPCRYVSGYICPNKNGMRGEGATHAWVDAWIPKFGWAGIDPTNNVWITNNHVKLAVGRNFNDCTPVKGNFKGPSRQYLFVFVSVGYEDGHVFQETNHVKLEKQEEPITEGEVAIISGTFAAQQQQ